MMMYSCFIEYSGRILLPQNDEIRMYVIYLWVFVRSFMEKDKSGAMALSKRKKIL